MARSILTEEQWARAKEYTEKEIICRPKRGIVYVLKAGDTTWYKVGLTNGDIDKRLSQLQTGNPLKISVVSVYFSNNVNMDERNIHTMLYEMKMEGEWFNLCENHLTMIEAYFNG